MVFGLWFAFFSSHRRVWVRLREEGGATAVVLAGNANKNREASPRSSSVSATPSLPWRGPRVGTSLAGAGGLC